MLAYQLDRCSDYPKLCTRCIEEGLANIFRFDFLKIANTTADPEIHSCCQQTGRILLTTDGRFHTDNARKITEPHNGIVIVNTSTHKHLTSKMVMSTLAKFKEAFDGWHLISPTNAVLFLTEEWVDLYRIVKGHDDFQKRFIFHESGWQQRLAQTLLRIGGTRNEPESATH